jgi:L-asparaginase II
MNTSNPVLIEVTRGGAVESHHRGSAAVVRADGTIVAQWGAAVEPVYPRSAIKPIQALALVESGAAEHFSLSVEELALACASHSGEPCHAEAVGGWLERVGLGLEALQCAIQTSRDGASADAMVRAGAQPTALNHNCSGKHAGMLSTALHMNEPIAGYLEPTHPVQRRVARILAEMGDCDLTDAARGIDGCGIPVIAMPLAAVALALARLAAPEGLEQKRATAARLLFAAMTAHPYLVAGRGRFDTTAMTAGGGAFAVKTGAEGVHVAAVPGLRLGIALKIDDGAGRAAEVAMAALLQHLSVLDDDARATLSPYLDAPVLNSAGLRVGTIRAAAGWPA